MEVKNKDINLLKSIADNLVNSMKEGFVLFANVKNDNSVNFIARSNCSINAGLIVKKASVEASGNGGGSPTFAQGWWKNTEKLQEILFLIENELKNEK